MHEPSEEVQQRISALLDDGLRMFLVHRPGPTSFVVSEGGGGGDAEGEPPRARPRPKYKVFIGQTQDCNCDVAVRGRGPCVHVLFAMLKVLRVPRDDPMVWQTSLTETEIQPIESRTKSRFGPVSPICPHEVTFQGALASPATWSKPNTTIPADATELLGWPFAKR